MQASSPEGLIGINIADSTDEVLIQQCPLDVGVLLPQRLRERDVIKVGIQGVPCDVGNASRNAVVVCACPRGGSLGGGNELIDGHRAKDSLVDKPHHPGFAP